MRRTLLFAGALALAAGLTEPAPAQIADPARLQAAAEAGDPVAQRALGDLYREGRQTPQDYAEAARWYEAAAGAGDAAAQNRLAALYATGRGVETDPARARDLLEAAAAQGDPAHVADLARAVESGVGAAPDPTRAADLYQAAAEAGHEGAQVSLGVLYQEGLGVPQDFARAFELFEGPAEAGNARAQNNLGLLYTRGDGVEQDYARAVDLFGRAADQDLPQAIRNLGVMYQNGFGVEVDEDRANALFRRAAAAAEPARVLFDPRLLPPDPSQLESYVAGARAGDPVAQFLLGYLIAASAESPAQHRQAADWFERAAASGSAAALANLGLMSFHGQGRLQDYVDGYAKLTLAARAGLDEAARVRDRLAERMTGAQIDAANREAKELAEAAER